MKLRTTVFVIALTVLGTPAYAQLGGLSGAIKKGADAKAKVDELTFTEAEERQIGDDVSSKIRQRFGVVQDPAIHKYVTLVGMTLAKASDRPNLAWTFVVLDTDGVNAFAAPGGIVHITRGALGLIRNEGELAGVLGHEIGHVTRKHTINAIQKNKAVQAGASATRSDMISGAMNQAYATVLENSFDRGDELDADRVAVAVTQKAGYAAAPLKEFLQRLDERNKTQAERNGLFASHPETKERIDKITQLASSSKTTALVEPRYKSNVKYESTAIAAVTTVSDGALAPKPQAAKQEAPKQEAPKEATKQEPPKSTGGFGLGNLSKSVTPQKESQQVSASGGVRGVGPDRAAKGGSNPALVKTSVSAAEVQTFTKGIV